MKAVLPKTMQAVTLDHFGGIENLKVKNLDVPEIGPGEILVRVECAGVGVWDPFEIEGGFAKMFGVEPKFPYVPGSDGAGTIEALGEGVSRFKEGQRVYGVSLGSPKGGFFAEYIVINADNISLVPDKLPTEQAGALPVDGITALEGLDDTLKLRKGESVMIFGASGGIGHLAVQLANRMGARVFAVASGQEGVDLAKRLGADKAIDGHRDDIVKAAREFAPDGIDAALFTAGGDAAQKAFACIKKGGRGAYPNGVEPEPQGHPGIDLKSYDGVPGRKVFDKLNSLIESGAFEVHIARTFTLDQVVEAQRALQSHFVGKLAIKPNWS